MADQAIPDKCKAPAAKVAQALMAPRPENMTAREYANLTKTIFAEHGKRKPIAADYIIGWQINSLLSSPKTAVANAISLPFQGVVTPINQIIESLITSAWKSARGKSSAEDLKVADVLAGFRNLTDNFSAAMKMSKEGYLRGYPLDVDTNLQQIAYSIGGTKADASRLVEDMLMRQSARLEAQRQGRNAEDVFNEMKEAGIRPSAEEMQSYMNESFDYFRNVFTGPISQYISTPTRVTVGIDEFGKSFFRVFGVQQQIAKKARLEAAKTGQSYNELFNRYRSEVFADAMTTDAKKNIANLRQNMGALFGDNKEDFLPFEDLKQFAASKLFQQSLTGTPRKLQLMMQDSAIMRLFIPFMKTPWNIAKEGLSYTPIAPIAKNLLRAKRKDDGTVNTAYRGAYYELSNEQLLARQVVGGAAFLSLGMMFDAGEITGTPKSSQERQQWRDEGKLEQAIRIGDTWYQYGRIEPVATVIQMYAELKRVAAEYDAAKDRGQQMTLEETGKEIMLGMKRAVMDKTFLEGLNDMVSTVAEGKFQNIPATIARQAVPTLSSDIARIADGKERQVSGDTLDRALGAGMQRIPILREMLPEEYGLYGGARETGSATEILSGFRTQSETERTPAQKAMDLLDVSKVRPNDKLRGVGLSGEELSEYRRLTAQFVTPMLNNLAGSPAFQRLPKGTQKVVLEKNVDKIKANVAKMMFAKLMGSNKDYARQFFIEEFVKKGYYDLARQQANQ